MTMSFTIKHFRDGACVGADHHAVTMHAARSHARTRQADLHSELVVICGETASGDEMEIEVIEFSR